MTEKKSLTRDLLDWWQKKHPPKKGYEFSHYAPKQEPSPLPEFINAFRDERAENRAHIDSLTRIIFDLTAQLQEYRELVNSLKYSREEDRKQILALQLHIEYLEKLKAHG